MYYFVHPTIISTIKSYSITNNQFDSLIIGKYAQCVMFLHTFPKRVELGIALRPLFQTTSFPGNQKTKTKTITTTNKQK